MPGSLVSALSDMATRGVEFIVVGGVAAVLQGAPVQTFDLDIVYLVEPANIDRLFDFLQHCEAIFRIQRERRLKPDRSHLEAGGHLNLETRYGPLDLLGTIGSRLSYRELVTRSEDLEISTGLRVRVLDLDAIIEIKEQLGSDKDRAALPVLRETLRMRRMG